MLHERAQTLEIGNVGRPIAGSRIVIQLGL